MEEFPLSTGGRVAFVDITGRVQEAAARLGVADGAVLVHVPHTTAGVTINEGADPDVIRDLEAALARIVPDHAVRLSQYSEHLARLVGRSAFFHFAVAYLADQQDKAAAARAFVPTAEVVAAFRSRVVAEKWLPEAEIDRALADPGDRRDIEVALRAEVLNAGASLSEGFRAFTGSDTQVQAALGLFDEAAKLHARARVGGPTTQASARR